MAFFDAINSFATYIMHKSNIKMWLGNVPEYTAGFVRIMFIVCVVMAFTWCYD